MTASTIDAWRNWAHQREHLVPIGAWW